MNLCPRHLILLRKSAMTVMLLTVANLHENIRTVIHLRVGA